MEPNKKISSNLADQDEALNKLFKSTAAAQQAPFSVFELANNPFSNPFGVGRSGGDSSSSSSSSQSSGDQKRQQQQTRPQQTQRPVAMSDQPTSSYSSNPEDDDDLDTIMQQAYADLTRARVQTQPQQQKQQQQPQQQALQKPLQKEAKQQQQQPQQPQQGIKRERVPDPEPAPASSAAAASAVSTSSSSSSSPAAKRARIEKIDIPDPSSKMEVDEEDDKPLISAAAVASTSSSSSSSSMSDAQKVLNVPSKPAEIVKKIAEQKQAKPAAVKSEKPKAAASASAAKANAKPAASKEKKKKPTVSRTPLKGLTLEQAWKIEYKRDRAEAIDDANAGTTQEVNATPRRTNVAHEIGQLVTDEKSLRNGRVDTTAWLEIMSKLNSMEKATARSVEELKSNRTHFKVMHRLLRLPWNIPATNRYQIPDLNGKSYNIDNSTVTFNANESFHIAKVTVLFFTRDHKLANPAATEAQVLAAIYEFVSRSATDADVKAYWDSKDRVRKGKSVKKQMTRLEEWQAELKADNVPKRNDNVLLMFADKRMSTFGEQQVLKNTEPTAASSREIAIWQRNPVVMTVKDLTEKADDLARVLPASKKTAEESKLTRDAYKTVTVDDVAAMKTLDVDIAMHYLLAGYYLESVAKVYEEWADALLKSKTGAKESVKAEDFSVDKWADSLPAGKALVDAKLVELVETRFPDPDKKSKHTAWHTLFVYKVWFEARWSERIMNEGKPDEEEEGGGDTEMTDASDEKSKTKTKTKSKSKDAGDGKEEKKSKPAAKKSTVLDIPAKKPQSTGSTVVRSYADMGQPPQRSSPLPALDANVNAQHTRILKLEMRALATTVHDVKWNEYYHTSKDGFTYMNTEIKNEAVNDNSNIYEFDDPRRLFASYGIGLMLELVRKVVSKPGSLVKDNIFSAYPTRTALLKKLSSFETELTKKIENGLPTGKLEPADYVSEQIKRLAEDILDAPSPNRMIIHHDRVPFLLVLPATSSTQLFYETLSGQLGRPKEPVMTDIVDVRRGSIGWSSLTLPVNPSSSLEIQRAIAIRARMPKVKGSDKVDFDGKLPPDARVMRGDRSTVLKLGDANDLKRQAVIDKQWRMHIAFAHVAKEIDRKSLTLEKDAESIAISNLYSRSTLFEPRDQVLLARLCLFCYETSGVDLGEGMGNKTAIMVGNTTAIMNRNPRAMSGLKLQGEGADALKLTTILAEKLTEEQRREAIEDLLHDRIQRQLDQRQQWNTTFGESQAARLTTGHVWRKLAVINNTLSRLVNFRSDPTAVVAGGGDGKEQKGVSAVAMEDEDDAEEDKGGQYKYAVDLPVELQFLDHRIETVLDSMFLAETGLMQVYDVESRVFPLQTLLTRIGGIFLPLVQNMQWKMDDTFGSSDSAMSDIYSSLDGSNPIQSDLVESARNNPVAFMEAKVSDAISKDFDAIKQDLEAVRGGTIEPLTQKNLWALLGRIYLSAKSQKEVDAIREALVAGLRTVAKALGEEISRLRTDGLKAVLEDEVQLDLIGETAARDKRLQSVMDIFTRAQEIEAAEKASTPRVESKYGNSSDNGGKESGSSSSSSSSSSRISSSKTKASAAMSAKEKKQRLDKVIATPDEMTEGDALLVLQFIKQTLDVRDRNTRRYKDAAITRNEYSNPATAAQHPVLNWRTLDHLYAVMSKLVDSSTNASNVLSSLKESSPSLADFFLSVSRSESSLRAYDAKWKNQQTLHKMAESKAANPNDPELVYVVPLQDGEPSAAKITDRYKWKTAHDAWLQDKHERGLKSYQVAFDRKLKEATRGVTNKRDIEATRARLKRELRDKAREEAIDAADKNQDIVDDSAVNDDSGREAGFREKFEVRKTKKDRQEDKENKRSQNRPTTQQNIKLKLAVEYKSHLKRLNTLIETEQAESAEEKEGILQMVLLSAREQRRKNLKKANKKATPAEIEKQLDSDEREEKELLKGTLEDRLRDAMNGNSSSSSSSSNSNEMEDDGFVTHEEEEEGGEGEDEREGAGDEDEAETPAQRLAASSSYVRKVDVRVADKFEQKFVEYNADLLHLLRPLDINSTVDEVMSIMKRLTESLSNDKRLLTRFELATGHALDEDVLDDIEKEMKVLNDGMNASKAIRERKNNVLSEIVDEWDTLHRVTAIESLSEIFRAVVSGTIALDELCKTTLCLTKQSVSFYDGLRDTHKDAQLRMAMAETSFVVKCGNAKLPPGNEWNVIKARVKKFGFGDATTNLETVAKSCVVNDTSAGTGRRIAKYFTIPDGVAEHMHKVRGLQLLKTGANDTEFEIREIHLDVIRALRGFEDTSDERLLDTSEDLNSAAWLKVFQLFSDYTDAMHDISVIAGKPDFFATLNSANAIAQKPGFYGTSGKEKKKSDAESEDALFAETDKMLARFDPKAKNDDASGDVDMTDAAGSGKEERIDEGPDYFVSVNKMFQTFAAKSANDDERRIDTIARHLDAPEYICKWFHVVKSLNVERKSRKGGKTTKWQIAGRLIKALEKIMGSASDQLTETNDNFKTVLVNLKKGRSKTEYPAMVQLRSIFAVSTEALSPYTGFFGYMSKMIEALAEDTSKKTEKKKVEKKKGDADATEEAEAESESEQGSDAGSESESDSDDEDEGDEEEREADRAFVDNDDNTEMQTEEEEGVEEIAKPKKRKGKVVVSDDEEMEEAQQDTE